MILTVENFKGGSGKTTTASNLAASAKADGYRVVLVDMDPQGSLTTWHDQRVASGLEDMECHSANPVSLKRLLTDPRALYVVDTPPHNSTVGRQAIAAADLVVVPTRMHEVDLAALNEAADLVKSLGKRAFCVLSDVNTNARVRQESLDFCDEIGLPVRHTVRSRVAVPGAFRLGRGVSEVPGGDPKAQLEFEELWQAVKAMMGGKKR